MRICLLTVLAIAALASFTALFTPGLFAGPPPASAQEEEKLPRNLNRHWY
jgi:hypothetical protein